MSHTNHQDIRIGTIAGMDKGTNYLRQILPHGFESFELTAWADLGEINLAEFAKEVLDAIGDQAIISSLGVYGNPLTEARTVDAFAECIRHADLFGAKCICGFTGAQEDRPIDQNMARFKEIWGPMAQLAEDHGVKIAFENCDMGGFWETPKWNLAHSPRAWEMMFNEVPSDALGLEWEPCHQMVSFIDPLPQLRKWVHKVHHIHGKDATVHKDLVATLGTRSGVHVVHHRTPGFGDTNWSDLITILRLANWKGSIDIEGWHDPVYRDDLEMTGQVYGLNYLKSCRGGTYVQNPI